MTYVVTGEGGREQRLSEPRLGIPTVYTGRVMPHLSPVPDRPSPSLPQKIPVTYKHSKSAVVKTRAGRAPQCAGNRVDSRQGRRGAGRQIWTEGSGDRGGLWVQF